LRGRALTAGAACAPGPAAAVGPGRCPYGAAAGAEWAAAGAPAQGEGREGLGPATAGAEAARGRCTAAISQRPRGGRGAWGGPGRAAEQWRRDAPIYAPDGAGGARCRRCPPRRCAVDAGLGARSLVRRCGRPLGVLGIYQVYLRGRRGAGRRASAANPAYDAPLGPPALGGRRQRRGRTARPGGAGRSAGPAAEGAPAISMRATLRCRGRGAPRWRCSASPEPDLRSH
jgi:hypothetical protein